MNASIVIKRRLPGGTKATMAEFEDIETGFVIDDLKAEIQRLAGEWACGAEPIPHRVRMKAAAYGAILDAAGELDDSINEIVQIICRVERGPAKIISMEESANACFNSETRASS